MKKTVIALLITAIILIFIVGCGESTPQESVQPSNIQATAATTSNNTTIPRQVQYTKGSLPSLFEKSVENGFVTVVAFYDFDDYISSQVSDNVDEVVEAPAYREQIKYLSYEVNGKTSSAVAKLTTTLGAKYTPHLTIIDGDKNIVFEKSGFIDSKSFEHALYNTVYKDKNPAE